MLLDYAAGNLHEAGALLTATHLALCPRCRGELAAFESLGGGLLLDTEATVPATADPDWPRTVPLDSPAPRAAVEANAGPHLVPRPLRDYVGDDLDRLQWQSSLRGIDECVLAKGAGGAKTALVRIAAGRTIPRHTHLGDELTLVLQGGFSDQRGSYRRGDVASADPQVTHRPVADEGGPCLCLTVVEGPVQLTGPVGWLINPFLRR